MRIFAPAKLNLSLEVLGKRDDGYHDLVSVMHTVSLGDWLTVEAAETIQVDANVPGLSGNSNLAARAAQALAAHAGIQRGCHIFIEKHIPISAGMAGGSSDAAAVLRALNRLWRLDLEAPELERIGAGIGSDVPFLIGGGTALVEGRGERVKPLPSPNPAWFVLANPREPVSTASVFAHLTGEDWTHGEKTVALADALRRDRRIRLGVNGLQAVSMIMYPASRRCYDLVREKTGSPALMSGSGPTVCALMPGEAGACSAATALSDAGLWSHAVRSHSPSEVL